MKGAIFATIMSISTAFGASSAHEFTLPSIDGAAAPLSAYKGKVALLVNVASQCGYTPQYAGLQALYEKYKERGFVVLGFPANNFGQQEPGSNAEIKQFCTRTYNVTFPMYGKISVAGSDQAPLYKFLTGATGGPIQWNFTKILVDGNGKVIRRFEPDVEPDSPELVGAVEKALGK
jgi:glutathione peroxidase